MSAIPAPLLKIGKWLQHSVEKALDYPLLSDPADWKVSVRPFESYGTKDRLRFSGRALRDHAEVEPTIDDSAWKNLLRTLHALESDEAPGIQVEVTARGSRQVAAADAEGFVDIDIQAPDVGRPPGWHELRATCLQTDAERDVSSGTQVGHCLVPRSGVPIRDHQRYRRHRAGIRRHPSAADDASAALWQRPHTGRCRRNAAALSPPSAGVFPGFQTTPSSTSAAAPGACIRC